MSLYLKQCNQKVTAPVYCVALAAKEIESAKYLKIENYFILFHYLAHTSLSSQVSSKTSVIMNSHFIISSLANKTPCTTKVIIGIPNMKILNDCITVPK